MTSFLEEQEALLKTGLRNYGGTQGQGGAEELGLVSVFGENNSRPTSFTDVNLKTTSSVLCCHGNPYQLCPAKHDKDRKKNSDTYITMEKHCHQQLKNGVDKKARKKLITATSMCVFFMTVEIVGGYLANSLAIATDAAHLLTDVASFGISLSALYVATLPKSKKMNFGWYRAEVVGALVSVLLIWVVTAVLVFMAVQRVRSGDYEIKGYIMIVNAVLGVCVNIIMGVVLNRKDSSEDEVVSTGENLNVRAAFIHVLGDLMQSLGVLAAALVIYFKPEWKIVDPICTFLFSVLVLITTLTILKDTVLVLMEGKPSDLQYDDVENCLKAIPAVMAVHDLKIWALSMERPAMSAHLAIKPVYNPRTVLKEAQERLKKLYKFQLVTLQIEDYLDEMSICDQCQPILK